MLERRSKTFPPSWTVPFPTYTAVTDFLREVETACILRGRPSDGTMNFGAVSRCLHELKRPDRAYRSIHVTGTNGKTAVSRMIGALIQAGGMKVGVYTSPHALHFRERIAINGQPIGEEELVDACNHVKAFLDLSGVQLAPFEFLTAAAFFAFRAAQVDYAVIEVGIGGRQDATNILAPELSVITNVEHDHADLLGETLEEIAAEKAGIIKPLTAVLCGPMSDGPRAVVLARAAELKAPVLLSGHDYDVMQFVRVGYAGSCTLRVGATIVPDVLLTSPAAFMATNASLALTAYDVLRRRGLVPELGVREIVTLFRRMELTACCEILPGAPTVVLDGSHNAPSAARLAGILRSTFEGRRSVWLVSLSRDTEWDTIIRSFAGAGADRIILTCYPSDRAVAPQTLAERWHACSSAAAEIVEVPDAAFTRALQAAGPYGVVVVTGSPQLGSYCRSLAKTLVTGSSETQ